MGSNLIGKSINRHWCESNRFKVVFTGSPITTKPVLKNGFLNTIGVFACTVGDAIVRGFVGHQRVLTESLHGAIDFMSPLSTAAYPPYGHTGEREKNERERTHALAFHTDHWTRRRALWTWTPLPVSYSRSLFVDTIECYLLLARCNSKHTTCV